MENKQKICDLLTKTLQHTENLSDLVRLQYDKELEMVHARFANGSVKSANVAMDSGTSMIRDIIEQIV